MNFVTTNIRLPKEVLKKLKHKAVEDNKSVSQLIREAVQKFILGPHKEANQDIAENTEEKARSN
jgi:predicted DNA-binding protein